jgi:hypothetical protein
MVPAPMLRGHRRSKVKLVLIWFPISDSCLYLAPFGRTTKFDDRQTARAVAIQLAAIAIVGYNLLSQKCEW